MSEATDPFGIVGTLQQKVFRVERAVAEGGFGVVYRAFHEVFRSPVALKCLKVPESLTDEQRAMFLERFRGEAELMFRLSAANPEVVRPLQFGLLESDTFVPFLALGGSGETLDEYVARRETQGKPPLTLGQALDLLTPIARVLQRAHHFSDKDGTVTIVHRDLKPENIFLTTVDGERRPKILDFGIARVRDETSAIAGKATKGDALNAFSPAYASPEQWHSQSYGSTGPWTDVYGLALTVTQVLIGHPPIGGELTAMLGAAINPQTRPTPRGRGAKLSDDAERAFQAALAVDPRSRTQEIEVFWSQLERSLGRVPSLRRRTASVSNESVPPPAPDLELDLPAAQAATQAAPAPLPAAPLSAPLPSAPRSAPVLPPITDPNVGGGSLDIGLGAGALDLDRGATRPRPRPSGPRPRPASTGVWVGQQAPSKSLGERYSGPAWMVFLAVAMGVADYVYAHTTGERLAFGPVRPIFVAGPLGLLGVALAIWRSLED
ncbi:MAG: serine/threonine-protein kinase [Polyangiaceae bacterium]